MEAEQRDLVRLAENKCLRDALMAQTERKRQLETLNDEAYGLLRQLSLSLPMRSLGVGMAAYPIETYHASAMLLEKRWRGTLSRKSYDLRRPVEYQGDSYVMRP